MLIPRTEAPDLEVPVAGSDRWSLRERDPENFTMIVFYRGFHCPICKSQLQSLDRRIEEFRARGVEVIAVSGDDQDRAEKAKQQWGLENLAVGYGQSVASMREWGLFVSRAIKESEPDLFGEPGIFLVRREGTVFYQSIQSMPFARPAFEDLLGAIDFVLRNDYPARGEVVGEGGQAGRAHPWREGAPCA